MKTVFRDTDPRTLATTAIFNSWQGHRHTGGTSDGDCPVDYAPDTGAANALAIALDPPLSDHVIGLPILIRVAAANTGACTLQPAGLAPKALTKHGASALAYGDLLAGQIIGVCYDGTQYQLLNLSSPVLSIQESELTTLQIFPANITLDQWHAVDLSSWLPAGSLAAIILLEWLAGMGEDTGTVSHKLYLRPNGSSSSGRQAYSLSSQMNSATLFTSQLVVPVGSNLKFDYRVTGAPSPTDGFTFRLQGWIK
jgi:hypothetical protein